MARIAGVDLPNTKKIEIALTYIYGLGLTRAQLVCELAEVSVDTRVRDLTEDEVLKIRRAIEQNFRVEGDLRPGQSALDALATCFPAGTVSGAPKVRAMEIIDNLEPNGRGLYAGAIGYLDARGGADLSVVIRTLLVREGRAHLHTGGAVVADSDPRDEWRETLDKAAPLRAALDSAI